MFGVFYKCSYIVTDAAKCMILTNTSSAGLLKKTDIKFLVLQSIIYQQILSSKFVWLNELIKDVKKLIKILN